MDGIPFGVFLPPIGAIMADSVSKIVHEKFTAKQALDYTERTKI
ncbi:hypothetical protein FACS1894200_14200 [Spirochaetia bacterium]|nr:hypothetical protein FACS1894200_14200 [Spirochaetia bacterium]